TVPSVATSRLPTGLVRCPGIQPPRSLVREQGDPAVRDRVKRSALVHGRAHHDVIVELALVRGPVEGIRPPFEADSDSRGFRVAVGQWGDVRSEEHTSELQSRENLVCRLLLEKKKTSQLRKTALSPVTT